MNLKKEAIIVLLILVLLILFYITEGFIMHKKMESENTDNIIIEKNTIQLSSLTLKQKLAQMIMMRGDEMDLGVLELNVGGIFLDQQKTEEAYAEKITGYQESSKIKLLVSTDLEGTWNPFNSFKEFPKNKDVKNEAEAFQMGKEQGELLKKLGFNMNFAPVSEYDDEIYGGRMFSGDKEEIKEKLKAYTSGLQENVAGTCKHYPGKGMIKNLHYKSDKQTIEEEDLELFQECLNNNISAVMVGHQVVEGKLDSQGKPSSVSQEVISSIPDNVLVISDEVNMRGLRNFYLFSKRKRYQDLINSGENLILDFKLDKKSAYNLILDLEEDVKRGRIKEYKVDESVRKILKLKGYQVI